jgi:hypothetical protein
MSARAFNNKEPKTMSNIFSIDALRRHSFDPWRERRNLLPRLRSLWSYTDHTVADAILDLLEIENDIAIYYEFLYGMDGPEVVNMAGFKAAIEKRRAAGEKLMQALERDRDLNLNRWLAE